MHLTIIVGDGAPLQIEVDAQMELENVKVLLEADTDIPADQQQLLFNGRELADVKQTLAQAGVADGDLILLQKKQPAPAPAPTPAAVSTASSAPVPRPVPTASAPPYQGQRSASTNDDADIERIRQQIISDPYFRSHIMQRSPDLVRDAQSNPARFAQKMRELRSERIASEQAIREEEELMSADPFNIEAQRRIEERIRQKNVEDSFLDAIEHNPELFGNVTMLYISILVNGHIVKAFVDSGAQNTIMSPACAERCGVMRLLDTRFAGVAYGVGTAKILGRVHNAPVKLGQLHLPCSFTILEGRSHDMLLGLDMLRRYQMSIDLKQNALVVDNQLIPFLPEHEIPKDNLHFGEPQNEKNDGQAAASTSSASTSKAASPAPATILQPTPQRPPVQTPLAAAAAAPQVVPTPVRQTAAAAAQAPSRHSEEKIRAIMEFGCSRQDAINALDAVGGNVDMAASLLFG